MAPHEQIHAAWNRVVGTARPTTPALTPAERATAWAGCVRRVREAFAAHAGHEALAARFAVPADYAAFMGSVGGGWEWLDGMEQSLFAAAVVAEVTIDDFRRFVTEREEDDGPQDDGFWLSIGRYSDKHDTLLCCDRSHRLYGRVLDAHDDHPWLNGLSSPFCVVHAESFAAWLGNAASRLTRDGT